MTLYKDVTEFHRVYVTTNDSTESRWNAEFEEVLATRVIKQPTKKIYDPFAAQ